MESKLHFQSAYTNETRDYKILQKVMVLNSSFIILVNLPLLVFLLYHHKKLLERHTAKYFINIQLIHIMVATFDITRHTYSPGIVVMNNILMTELFLSMLMANGDRYFAISKPFVYQKMTSKKTYLLIAVSWTMVLIELFLLNVFHVTKQLVLELSLTILMAVSITVLTYSNIVIWFIARKHAISIAQNSVNGHRKEAIRRRQLKKSTVSCLLFVGSFVVLYTPFLIHNVIAVTTEFTADPTSPFTVCVVTITSFNGLVDPITYVISNGDIKAKLTSSLKYFKKKQIVQPDNETQTREI